MDDKTTMKIPTTMVAGFVLAGTLSHKLEHIDPPPEVPILPNIATEATVVSSTASAITLNTVIAAIQKMDGKFKG